MQAGQLSVPKTIKDYIPNSKLMMEGLSKENPDHFEYSFTVMIDQNDQSKRLSTMFEKLSSILQTGHVIEFTLTRTTLEQVFVNFAKFQVNYDISGNQGGAPMHQAVPMGVPAMPQQMQG